MSHPIEIFQDGRLVRLRQIIAPHGPLPIGRSTWWAGVKAGIFPQPVKIGQRITAWRAEDILDLIERKAAARSRPQQATQPIMRPNGGVAETASAITLDRKVSSIARRERRPMLCGERALIDRMISADHLPSSDADVPTRANASSLADS